MLRQNNKRLLYLLIWVAIGGLCIREVPPLIHLQSAKTALARRELSRADALLRRCQNSWFCGHESHLLSVRSAALAGEWQKAEALLRKTTQTGKRTQLEDALLMFRSGDTSHAETWLIASEDLLGNTQVVNLLEALIDGAVRDRDPELAQSCLGLWTQMTGIEPDSGDGNAAARSKLAAWQGDLTWSMADVAIDFFRRAVELEPRNESAELKLAILLIEYDCAEARQRLRVLAQKSPDAGVIRLQLAGCERKLGNFEVASQLLDVLLKQNPADVLVLLERGQLSLDESKLDEAEEWLRKAEKQEPGNRAVLRSLARCLQLAGRVEEAAGYRRKATP